MVSRISLIHTSLNKKMRNFNILFYSILLAFYLNLLMNKPYSLSKIIKTPSVLMDKAYSFAKINSPNQGIKLDDEIVYLVKIS